jgi:hypothetical protein
MKMPLGRAKHPSLLVGKALLATMPLNMPVGIFIAMA